MSEPTLYREHFTDENEIELGKEGWIYAGTSEFGIFDRWMVPVEPDYEAHVRQNVALSVSAEDARAIVDAALGIGGGHE